MDSRRTFTPNCILLRWYMPNSIVSGDYHLKTLYLAALRPVIGLSEGEAAFPADGTRFRSHARSRRRVE
jgi:hypothetical protein